MKRIPDASSNSLMDFVNEAIEPGSTVHADGWLGYDPLQGRGCAHEITVLKGQEGIRIGTGCRGCTVSHRC
jgi:hypothetical protein